MRIEHIGDATLYLGDCLEVLPTLGKVDAVVTDPPYGIGADASIHCTKPSRPSTYIDPDKYENLGWDIRPTSECIKKIIAMGNDAIIWGGNYFVDSIWVSRGWLFWNKLFENTTNFSHGELAWTSLEMPLKMFTCSSKAETRGGKDREHPTQKPVALMEWCLGFLPNAETILDPFMGSGTTGVACANLGRKFIGIEIEPKYFDIACKRIEIAYQQPRLFDEPRVTATQQELGL